MSEISELLRLREGLRLGFEQTADLRRQKAEEHPYDEGNIEAAGILDHLAATVHEIPHDLIRSYGRIVEDEALEDRWKEIHQEMLEEQGFIGTHKDAESFVRSLVDRVSNAALV